MIVFKSMEGTELNKFTAHDTPGVGDEVSFAPTTTRKETTFIVKKIVYRFWGYNNEQTIDIYVEEV